MRFISDIKENEHVVEHYYCKQKALLRTNAGKPYLSLKLQDKTGVADAKVWELTADVQDFEENDVIKIDGVAIIYANNLQIKVSKVRRSLEGEYEPSDYIPATEKDIGELYERLLGFIASIEHPRLRELAETILTRGGTVAGALKTHPAAKNLHHAYLGGLLEHTVAVTELCDCVSARYDTNRDLLITAALLHDAAKVYELTPLPQNVYTDDGQLLGHLYMGAELISRECAKIEGFPHTLESLLKHMLLSHHGQYEFGSPKLPSTIEAYILHWADNLDAKVRMFTDIMKEPPSAPGGLWTGYNKTLERYVRVTGC
jgi:3'-5' exoribonuclease